MDFDERIERLTERHEALAQSVELLLLATRQNTENIDKLLEVSNKLVEVSNHDAENIRALARIVEAHERRIGDIEDGKV